MVAHPSYIFLSQFQPNSTSNTVPFTLLPLPHSQSNSASKNMASSVPETTVCWLTFSGMPLSINHEALVGQLVDMLGGGPMRVVRTELSKIQVVTPLLHPSNLPMVCDIILNDRKYRITIDISETDCIMQSEVLRCALEMGWD